MKYIHFVWHKAQADDDFRELYVEIDDERWEVRRIELYADQSTKFVGHEIENDNAYLASEAWPPLDSINADPEFSARYIDKEDFERNWSKSTQA